MTGKHERHLAQLVDLAAGAVMRSPGSGGSRAGGSTTDHLPGEGRPQPDLLIATQGFIHVLELKTGSAPHYFTAEEVAALQWFAEQVGGDAVLVSRFPRDACFRFWDPAALHRTDSGNYRAKPDDPPFTVLADPSSDAEDPPGHPPEAMAEHGLLTLMHMGPPEA